MTIKSKKWYENQIKVLENAIKNIKYRTLYLLPYDNTEEDILRTEKYNECISKEISLRQETLNELKDEYYLYYK